MREINYYVVRNGSLFVAMVLQSSIRAHGWSLADIDRQVRVQHSIHFEAHSAPIFEYLTYYLIKFGLFSGYTFTLKIGEDNVRN